MMGALVGAATRRPCEVVSATHARKQAQLHGKTKAVATHAANMVFPLHIYERREGGALGAQLLGAQRKTL